MAEGFFKLIGIRAARRAVSVFAAAAVAAFALTMVACPAKEGDGTQTSGSQPAGADKKPAMDKKTPDGTKAAPAGIQASGREAVALLEAAFWQLEQEQWKPAQAELLKLKELQEKFDGADKAKRDRMLKAAKETDEAIRETKKHESLKSVNEAIFAASEIAYIGDPKMPNELFRLRFYARELIVWAAAKDQAKQKAAVLNIKESWQPLKAELNALGEKGAEIVKRFEPLTMALDLADTPEKLGGIARPILGHTDEMQKIFAGN